MRYREAAVAGQFYPSASADLRHLMAEYFAAEPSDSTIPKALIVPHAGYFYSGLVAAAAYRLINNAKRPFSRVILFGPSHYVALEGCAVPSSDIFVTPMGEVTVDRQLAQSLTREKLAVESAKAHHWEHSLEVQLPFYNIASTILRCFPSWLVDLTLKTFAKYWQPQPNNPIP